jgi:hypothetical protein
MTNTKVPCPVLGLKWQVDHCALLLACADNKIKKWDLQANQVFDVGYHDAPIKDVFSLQ